MTHMEWRTSLSPADLSLYESAKAKVSAAFVGLPENSELSFDQIGLNSEEVRVYKSQPKPRKITNPFFVPGAFDLSHIAEPLRGLAVPLDTLNLDPENAKKHGEASITALKASLRQFGQDQPLVVQTAGSIVRKGNGRLMAMRELGWKAGAVVFVDDTDKKAVARALTDNRAAELSSWNFGLLSRLAESVKSEVNLKEYGWDPEELAVLALASKPSSKPTVPVLPANPDAAPKGAIAMTAGQRRIFEQAYEQLRREVGGSIPEGRAIEFICTEWLQDPNRQPKKPRR